MYFMTEEGIGQRRVLARGRYWPEEGIGQRKVLARGGYWPVEPTGHCNNLPHWSISLNILHHFDWNFLGNNVTP